MADEFIEMEEQSGELEELSVGAEEVVSFTKDSEKIEEAETMMKPSMTTTVDTTIDTTIDTLEPARDTDSVEPPNKRVKFSPDACLEELKILENKEIKTGSIKCNNALISIDNQDVDLFNISSEITSKIRFNQPSVKAQKENLDPPKIRKSLEKRLDTSCPFLNYLGQSITSKCLDENYQAIPYKFVVYQENDFRLPSENIQEQHLTNLLIVICPTDCKGGVINFRKFRKSISGQSDNNVLNYVLFGIKTHFEISKVTEGLRVIIKYKIFKNPLEIVSNDLTVIDEERLRNMFKNMTEKNVLIPVTEANIAKKICDDLGIEYQEVYANEECPQVVFDEVCDNDESDYRPYDYLEFNDLVECSTQYPVETIINFSKPQINSERLTKGHNKYYPPSDSSYEVDYYTFILINPCDGKKDDY